MVSRRDYFTITIVMLIIFFLFQFSNVALEKWNNYEVNSYVADKEELPASDSAYQVSPDNSDEPGSVETEGRDMVIYIGGEDEPVAEVAYMWAAYTKRDIRSYGTLGQYEAAGWTQADVLPKVMLIDSTGISWGQEEEYERLMGYVDQGVNLVFCNLPDASAVNESRQLQELLGVKEVKEEETTVTGIHLFKGFLLGGEIIYQVEDEAESEIQDMELTFPWYSLASGTKIYMRGMLDEEAENEKEESPAVIWRKGFGTAFVFVINGGYMEDMTGLGILSAISAEIEPYEIYPVVNAQNMVFVNYPGMASENDEVMRQRYNQPMQEVFRDVIWPNIVTAFRSNKLGLTCMLTPQYDYTDLNYPLEEELKKDLMLINEQRAEAGMSGVSISGTPVVQKLIEDAEFVEDTLPGYQFASFYAGSAAEEEVAAGLEEEMLEAVRTVVEDYDGSSDLIGYQSEDVTRQAAVADGFRHTYRQDFRVKSVETALGYTNFMVNMLYVAYPGEGDVNWQRMAEVFSWNLDRYYGKFQMFSGTTVSESDGRVRNFLELDYEDKREGDIIHLELNEGDKPVWFILRTHGETISHIDGGSWQQVEDGAYLIEAEGESVTIELKLDDSFRYIYE